MSKTDDSHFDKGLPASLDAEKFVLGSILANDTHFPVVAGTLSAADFSIEKHRRIFRRMGELHGRGEPVDRLTVFSELDRHSEAQSCDGFSYLAELDVGLPHLENIDAYVRIVQEKSTLRKAIFAAQALIDRCMLETEPSAEILAGAETAINALAQSNAGAAAWVTPYGVIEAYPGGLEAFLNPPHGGIGIPTPWPALTDALAGLHPGELFVVAGRPSMGKSVVGMQMAHHAAKRKHGTAVFSLEMSKESLVQRMLAGIARVDSQKVRLGYVSREERERLKQAAAELDELPLWINETRARTVSAMTAALHKIAAKNRVELVVIDHLQLMAGFGRQREQNRHTELSLILHALKHEAVSMQATVVLLSQLNRQCEIENRRPQLSDLKETGTIEEDADVVMFVHRPERYMKTRNREDLRGHAEFIVAKQRNGPTGLKRMVFLDTQQRFESCAGDVGPMEDAAA